MKRAATVRHSDDTLSSKRGTTVTHVTRVGRVVVPVADQDKAIEFYGGNLGFTVVADLPFGDGFRWVEMAPPGGGSNVALSRPEGEFQPGRDTGILLSSADPAADRTELAGRGVDVDAALMGGEGGVPLMFAFRDQDANTLMIVHEA